MGIYSTLFKPMRMIKKTASRQAEKVATFNVAPREIQTHTVLITSGCSTNLATQTGTQLQMTCCCMLFTAHTKQAVFLEDVLVSITD